MTLQAKLGYVLIGILGEKCLRQYGYPHVCVIRILHHILDMAGVKVGFFYKGILAFCKNPINFCTPTSTEACFLQILRKFFLQSVTKPL